MWMIKVKHGSGRTNLLSTTLFRTRQKARWHIKHRLRPLKFKNSMTAIWPVKVSVKYTEITQ